MARQKGAEMSRAGHSCVAILVVWGLTAGTAASGAESGSLRARAIEPDQVLESVKSPAGLVSVIVKLDADPIATYRGGIAGLAATSPQVTRSRLRRAEPSVQAYEQFLAGKERSFGAVLARAVPRARIVHRLRTVFGGVSVLLPRERVQDLRTLPGVRAIYPDVLLPLDTDRSPQFIGAPTLWSKVGGQGKAGEGIVVGIVDTGIWPESPSVQDDGTFPPPPAKWTGPACEFGSGKPGDAFFSCDHKLIGARRMMRTFDTYGPPPGAGEYFTARDNNGHGSHTATIAAGNANVAAEFNGVPLGVLSGIAPRAHLAVYKVCFTVSSGASAGLGSCYTSDSVAAIEQAILDGVDVINFSIGGGAKPYSDAVSLAFLDAYAAGVFVACSAGNDGPGADTVGHREPWTTTAAATTTDKLYYGSASLTADGGASLELTGVSSYQGILPAAPIVLSSASPYADDLCLSPASPGSLAGKIVACKRGTNPRVAKSANLAAGGALGMILYNTSDTQTLNADIHSIPTLHVDRTRGEALVMFLGTQSEPRASIVGMRLLTGKGDVTAAFSSRGGAGQDLGISKPDIGAPGVDILAGYSGKLAVPVGPDGQIFNILSGTSMAAPHVAGAAALLKQLHPSWGPGQIKSALMMTATDAVVKEDGTTPATPFDVGSGRIDLAHAGDAGLLIAETADNFVALQSNLWLANYPSLYLPVMPGKVAVPRRLFNALKKGSHWTTSVEAPPDVRIEVPHHIEFHRRSETREVWIYIDASRVPLGEVRHARVLFQPVAREHGWGEHEWRERDPGEDEWGERGCEEHGWQGRDCGERRPEPLAFPITFVRQQGGITLVKSCDDTQLALGEVTQCTISATNTTFQKANIVVSDWMPWPLRLGAVVGARRLGPFGLVFKGTLGAAEPPGVTVAPGPSPAGGYLPLSLFGIGAIDGMGDETIANFSVPAFTFAGQSYTRLGVVSNGYVVVGGGTSADVTFVNQKLPDPAPPNNVLAPFWTDLDLSPSKGGAVRVANLTDGIDTWIVVDWDQVRVFTASDPQKSSFQVWIRVGGTVEDITYAYGPVGSGDGGLLTVGAENVFGNRGQSYYYNGTGTAPADGIQLAVTGTPGGSGETHVITFDAIAHRPGPWVNCADLSSDAVFGITTSCVPGEVTKRH
jgi:subtilisin family serine protease